MGITLREIIYEIGGGIPDGKTFKAVQTGGPSGGCIPAEHLDSPVDYESLARIGSIMGSGGMIVMDETSCMVDVAKYFMEFCMSESCGKCVPCRAGTAADARHPGEDHRGRSHRRRIWRCSKNSATWCVNTSLCGLGQSAPNPVLTTLRYFRNEYEAHVDRQRLSGRNLQGQRRGDRMSPRGPIRVRTLTIDGREVGAREDQTILEVARENNIFIPTLCHLPGPYRTPAPAASAWWKSRASTSCCRPASRASPKAWKSP